MSEPEQLIRAFWHSRAKLGSGEAARWHADHARYDRAILEKLCKPNDRILDLGCGTCDLANWLVLEREAIVHGVDGQQEFLTHAASHPRLTVELADVRSYQPNESFDAVILFGVIVHLVDPAARDQLYNTLSKSLKSGGFLLIKSQLGMDKSVEVNGFSPAFNHHYYAVYPRLSDEVTRLSRYFDVEILDLYPPELSPHQNTKFRHLLCRKKS